MCGEDPSCAMPVINPEISLQTFTYVPSWGTSEEIIHCLLPITTVSSGALSSLTSESLWSFAFSSESRAVVLTHNREDLSLDWNRGIVTSSYPNLPTLFSEEWHHIKLMVCSKLEWWNSQSFRDHLKMMLSIFQCNSFVQLCVYKYSGVTLEGRSWCLHCLNLNRCTIMRCRQSFPYFHVWNTWCIRTYVCTTSRAGSTVCVQVIQHLSIWDSLFSFTKLQMFSLKCSNPDVCSAWIFWEIFSIVGYLRMTLG